MRAVLREEDSSLEVGLRGPVVGLILRDQCWQQVMVLVPLEIWVVLGIWVSLEGRYQQVLVQLPFLSRSGQIWSWSIWAQTVLSK